MKDLAHGPPVDTEPFAQFVPSRASLVTGDVLLDLLALELPGGAWHTAVVRRWSTAPCSTTFTTQPVSLADRRYARPKGQTCPLLGGHQRGAH